MNEWVPPAPSSPPPIAIDPLPPGNSWNAIEGCSIAPDQPSFVASIVLTNVPATILAPYAWGITLNDGGSPPSFTIDHYNGAGALIDHPLEFSGVDGSARFNDPVTALSLTITTGQLTIPSVSQLTIPGGPVGNYLGSAGGGVLTWFTPPPPVIPTDAPSDGQLYGRENGAWEPISVGTGFLPLTGGTMSGGIVFDWPTTGPMNRYVGGASLGIMRWALLIGDNASETGSNAGSNFTIQSFADSGNPLGFPFSINRATGQTTLTVPGGVSPLALNTPAAGWKSIQGQTNGTLRWQMYLGDFNGELGGNLGSNFRLTAYGDTGAPIGDALFGNRQTRQITFGVMPSIPGGTLGYVLTTDGSGNLSWGAIPPSGIADAPNDGQQYARQSQAWSVIPPPAIATDAPSDGQQYARQNAAWVPFVSGPPTTISDTAPANPAVGQLWWDSVGGQLYVFYNDGNSSQWVIANSGAALPPATTTVLGGVKVDGTSIKAAVDGTISTVVLPANPNRVDNGDMWVDQHNNGGMIAVPANGAAVCPDRFASYNTQATSRFNVIQNGPAVITGGPPGFQWWLGIVSQSAYTSAAAASFYIQHGVEATAISDFMQGTANAQPFTVSFWARSSLTGNFSFAIQSGAGSSGVYRTYVTTFSLPTANTWTKITITIPGDTGGAIVQWPQGGSAAGMYLVWDIGSGANVQTSTLNAWQGIAANPYAAAGAVHVTGTNGANYAITGVKLELGGIATPWAMEDPARKLARCQRYFQVGQFGFMGYTGAAQQVYASQPFPVQMRSGPTMVIVTNNSSNLTATPTYAPLAPGGMGMTLIGNAVGAGAYVLNVNYTMSAEI